MSTSGSRYGTEGFTDYEDHLNWDAVGSPVPLGDYDVEVVKAQYKPTSAGKHMCKVQFKIESAYERANEKAKDRLVLENFVFTQEDGFRVKDFAEVTGVELPAIVNRQVIEEWAASIVGIKVGINVKHREWQGSVQAGVDKRFRYQSGAQQQEQQAEEQRAASAPAKPQSTLRQALSKRTTKGTGRRKPAATPKAALKSDKRKLRAPR